MNLTDIKSQIAFAEAIRAKRSLKMMYAANSELLRGKVKPKRNVVDKKRSDNANLALLENILLSLQDSKYHTSISYGRKSLKDYFGIETDNLSREELIEQTEIRISSLKLQTSSLTFDEKVNSQIEHRGSEIDYPVVYNALYMINDLRLIDKSFIEVDLELVHGKGETSLETKIPRGDEGVYNIVKPSLNDKFISLRREDNIKMERVIDKVFPRFIKGNNIDDNKDKLSIYFRNSRQELNKLINNRSKLDNIFINIIGNLVPFSQEEIYKYDEQEVDAVIDLVQKLTRVGQEGMKPVNTWLSDLRNHIFSMALEGLVDEKVLRLAISVYHIPIVREEDGPSQQIIVPIIYEVREGVFVIQENEMPPLSVDGSRFIIASPSKSVAKITGVPGIMFQKIDLEMPEEARGNINEILMTNEALRNTIRSRVIQEELSQISGSSSFSKSVIGQIALNKKQSIGELMQDKRSLLVDFITHISSDLCDVDRELRKLARFYSKGNKGYKIDVDDGSIYEIAPLLQLIQDTFESPGKTEINVLSEIRDLDDYGVEAFMAGINGLSKVYRDENVNKTSVIMKIAGEIASRPKLVWDTNSRGSYESYLNNIIYMIAHKKSIKLEKDDPSMYRNIFKEVMGITEANINEFYYHVKSEISLEDVNNDKLNAAIFDLNALLGAACSKTGFLKDVGSIDLSYLNAYDLKKIPSIHLTLKALERTSDVDIVRDYNLMTMIIQKYITISKGADAITKFFKNQIKNSTTLRNILRTTGLEGEEFEESINYTISIFNDIEKFLILYNTAKFITIPLKQETDKYRKSKVKDGCNMVLHELVNEIGVTKNKINTLVQLPPLVPYNLIRPKVKALEARLDELNNNLIYVPVKNYSDEEIEQMNQKYLKFLVSHDQSILSEIDYDYISYENLTVFNPTMKGEYCTVALKEQYDTDFDESSFKLNFGKFIKEEEYDLDEPEVCMLEIMEGLPEGERIFLPYEFKKKIVEYAERFSDTMTGRGVTIRDMALNILKEKSKDE